MDTKEDFLTADCAGEEDEKRGASDLLAVRREEGDRIILETESFEEAESLDFSECGGNGSGLTKTESCWHAGGNHGQQNAAADQEGWREDFLTTDGTDEEDVGRKRDLRSSHGMFS